MYKKWKKTIALIVLFSFLWVRVFFVVPNVLAEDTPPSAPSAPAVPPPPPPLVALPPPSSNSTPPPPPPTISTEKSPSSLPTIMPPPPLDPLPTINSSVPTQNPLPTQEVLSVASPSGSGDSQSSGTISGASSGGNLPSATISDSSTVNDPANVGTGPASKNYGSETLTQKMETLNTNLAQLQNKVDAISKTGFNYANLNTLDGKVFTGDSLSSTNLFNKLNSNISGVGEFAVYTIYGHHLGDIVFDFANPNTLASFASASATVDKNAVTGPGSENTASSSSSFTVKEANGNDATLSNDIVLESVSGGNSASENTGNGTVTTGKATVLGNIVNLANTNLNVSKWLFAVVNILGTLAGNIILPQETAADNNSASPGVTVTNSGSGPLSSNQASYSESETANFENANSAQISNDLNVSANTGNNTSSFNTGGGFVSSGDSDTSITDTSVANTNVVDEQGTVWVVIVNEMGHWVGHIIGEPWGTNVASNSLPIQSGSSSGSSPTSVENSATGPLSVNNASASVSTDESFVSENKAAITNNITANADSGNNQTIFNTGSGEITTGDAKAGVNLLNMTNTNVVAKKFVAVIINVLGDFLGSIVPPSQTAPESSLNTGGSLVASGASHATIVSPTPTGSKNHDQSQTAITNSVTPTPTPKDNSVNGQQSQSKNTVTPSFSKQYSDAVQTVTTAKRVARAKAKSLISNPAGRQKVASQIDVVNQQRSNLHRGLFLSAKFVKATESSLGGTLFAGASLRVNESWLAIVPFAVILFFLRRRKQYNLSKFANFLLEVIL